MNYEVTFSMSYLVKGKSKTEAEDKAMDMFAFDIGDSYGDNVEKFNSKIEETTEVIDE